MPVVWELSATLSGRAAVTSKIDESRWLAAAVLHHLA